MRDVTICIGTYNRLEYTRVTLDSILSNTVSSYSIVVVDDCSTDGTREYLMKLRDQGKIEVVLKKKNTGFCHVFNIKRSEGIKRGSKYIVLFDNDVTVVNGWLRELIRANQILIRNWKGKRIPILKGFNRGEKSYQEKFEFEGVWFARAPVVGGLCWLMSRDICAIGLPGDVEPEVPWPEGWVCPWIDNRSYRKRLVSQGFEEAFVLLRRPSLVDHTCSFGIHTTSRDFPRGVL